MQLWLTTLHPSIGGRHNASITGEFHKTFVSEEDEPFGTGSNAAVHDTEGDDKLR